MGVSATLVRRRQISAHTFAVQQTISCPITGVPAFVNPANHGEISGVQRAFLNIDVRILPIVK
jgi:hypothetical protein